LTASLGHSAEIDAALSGNDAKLHRRLKIMKLNILTRTTDLEAIEPGWGNLLRQPGNNKIQHRFDWFMAGYRSFHSRDQLYVLTVMDGGGNLSGVAPFVITTGAYRGLKVKKIGFAKNDQNPANDFILAEGKEEDCLKLFLDHLTCFLEWELVDLQKLNEAGTGHILRKMLSERGHSFGTKENIQSPYIRTVMGWEDFWESKSPRFRKAMRNKINRAMKHENLTIERIAVTSAGAPELEDMLRVSANSWKHEIGNDLLTREDNWKFYKEICDVIGPKGLIYIWLLRLDGIPVAFEFHVQYNNVVYPIRADYDKYHKNISPGSILEHGILKELFSANDVLEYNTCGHTYEYLMNWTNITRKHVNFEAFKKSIKMMMLYNLEYRILAWFRHTYLYRYFKRAMI